MDGHAVHVDVRAVHVDVRAVHVDGCAVHVDGCAMWYTSQYSSIPRIHVNVNGPDTLRTVSLHNIWCTTWST